MVTPPGGVGTDTAEDWNSLTSGGAAPWYGLAATRNIGLLVLTNFGPSPRVSRAVGSPSSASGGLMFGIGVTSADLLANRGNGGFAPDQDVQPSWPKARKKTVIDPTKPS